jgi:hypothetical protein
MLQISVTPTEYGQKAQPDYVEIATPLVLRGFRVTSVHPETKSGVMRNWQNHRLANLLFLPSFSHITIEQTDRLAHPRARVRPVLEICVDP